MKKSLSLFIIACFVLTTSSPVLARSGRSRVPTQYGSSEQQTSSFRGGRLPGYNQQMDGQMPMDPQMMMQSPTMGAHYQIHVLGEVVNPGTYRIAASDRLAAAIKKAGGLAEQGSERRIELRRKGAKTKYIDLLRFQLHGNLNDNPYLMDNDVVFVPLQRKVVQVMGAVRRPQVYELKNEKTLASVIKLAGGFNAAVAKNEPVRVIRFVDGDKVVDEIGMLKEDMSRFTVNAGDVIVVPNVITQGTKFDYNLASVPGDKVFYPSYEDRVFVLGGVSLPGAYPFSPYYSLNQYISLAGGLSDRGVPKYQVVTIDGKTRKANASERVNPGDTIMIKERWMSPAGWMGFALSIASFGLSATSTAIVLTR